jgi:hypothetical protein
MLYLLGGVAILCGLLLLGYFFVNADPARLARTLKWAGLAVAVLLLLALAVISGGRLLVLLTPLAALFPILRRMGSLFSGFRGPSTGQSSEVETAFIRMRLDHDTGEMSGTVLRGRFAGSRIEELGRAQLLALLRECRTDDEQAARLVEAYLDRAHPGWRDDLREEPGTQAPPTGSTDDVTVDEAYAILGLAPGADAAAIRAAHHRLMKQLHPDHGGTDYLATKINRARDVLLRG